MKGESDDSRERTVKTWQHGQVGDMPPVSQQEKTEKELLS